MKELVVSHVSYSYRTKYQTVQAVKEVCCSFYPGEFCAIVGKSGSGKTTLLSLLAGLEQPEQGEILLDGAALKQMDLDLYRRQQASVIYQNYNLFPLMTVQENVMYPLILNRCTKTQAAVRAGETLTQMGLGENYWKRLPAMLSGGEQQRVAIARALAVNAQIILADEPTGNLDTENTGQIVSLLLDLAHRQGCCVILVTHDLAIAQRADRVFRMESGRLTQEVAE